MTWLSNNVVITAPDSTFVGNQKCLVLNKGLFVVQIGTASFTLRVDMSIVTTRFIHRPVHKTDAVKLLDCQLAVAVTCLSLCTSRNHAWWRLVIHCLLVTSQQYLMLDLMIQAVLQWNERSQENVFGMGARENQDISSLSISSCAFNVLQKWHFVLLTR
jgi:hypothetical protein